MDLLLKSFLAVIIALAILFLAYYIFKHVSFLQPISKNQASGLVLHDLEHNYPSAIINITNVTQSQYIGSWHIVASVIDNATSPCPTYDIYSFDYPAYGFVYRVDNKYTENCIIYGLVSGNYTIGSYPVAIARSYQLNISQVRHFVSAYGYSNMVVTASYYNTTSIRGNAYNKIWLVNYTTPKANYSVHIVLSQLNGSIMNIYNTN